MGTIVKGNEYFGMLWRGSAEGGSPQRGAWHFLSLVVGYPLTFLASLPINLSLAFTW